MILFADFNKTAEEHVADMETAAASDIEETHQALAYQCLLYVSCGTSDKRRLLLEVAKSRYVLLAYTAVKSLLSYAEARDVISAYDTEEDAEFKRENNEAVDARNKARRRAAFDLLPDVVARLMVDSDVVLALKTEALRLLTESPDHLKAARRLFLDFVQDADIDAKARYMTITRLENKIGVSSPDTPLYGTDEIILECCASMVGDASLDARIRILAAQRLIALKEHEQMATQHLLRIAEDESLDMDTRADAADAVMRGTDPDATKRAQGVIDELARVDGFKLTASIYSNAQNVHVSSLEQSVTDIVCFLAGYACEHPHDLTFESVCEAVRATARESPNYDKVNSALNRIDVDRSLYNGAYGLRFIFVSLWNYISNSEHFEAMKVRLEEELVDMSNTCSSGYVARICNVISGFGGPSVSISVRDQIVAYCMNALEKEARVITSSDIFRSKDVITDILRVHADIGSDLLKDVGEYETACELYERMAPRVDELLADFQQSVLVEFTEQDYAQRRFISVFIRTIFPHVRAGIFEEFSPVCAEAYIDEALIEVGKLIGC